MKTSFSNCLQLITISGLLLLPAAWARADTVTRVSVDSAGGQAVSDSTSQSISTDGRFVAFVSAATNLAAGGTNGLNDIFVHDSQTGITSRVSVNSVGGEADGNSWSPSISADGRFVAFVSDSTNLVAGDTNGVSDIFMRDCNTGITTRISVDSAGAQASGASNSPFISADGRFVAYFSYANNLVAGDTNGATDVFVYDNQTGATIRVSVDSVGTQANGYSYYPSMSADGRIVAFLSSATNLVAIDTNGVADVFVHDIQTGITTRATVTTDGAELTSYDMHPSISANGRFVVFEGHILGGTAYQNILVRDLQTSVTTSEGQGIYYNDYPSISADGRFLVYRYGRVGIPNSYGIFRHDRWQANNNFTVLDADRIGVASNGDSYTPTISANGLFTAFASARSNLVVGDTNGATDIFVYQSTYVAAPDADLSLSVSAPSSVLVGNTITYTMIVTNIGPAPATTITVSGTLPSCTAATLDPGASISCTQTVTAATAGTLTQTMAAASANVNDPQPANNSASVSTMVYSPSTTDLDIKMTDAPDPVKKGAKLVYTISVTNHGPSTSTGVTMTDVLASTDHFESVTTSRGKCRGTATVTCAIGTLANGASATVKITVKPMIVGTLTNNASASANEYDHDLTNNSASATTVVTK